MKSIKKIELLQWPTDEVLENFEFDAITGAGTFNFHFKWLNNRWNLWVTLPDGTVREAGVYPNVVSWSGYNDYGLMFNTSLQAIDKTSLFLTEIVLVTWE